MKKDRHHIAAGGNAQQKGGARIFADRFQPQAEIGALQDQDKRWQCQSAAMPSDHGAQAQALEHAAARVLGEGLGAAHRADAGALPGAEDQPDGQCGGDKVHAQGRRKSRSRRRKS